jgi:tryptophan synthase alpha chain
MIRETRAKIDAPIVLFTYANPVLRMGEAAFVTAAADAGVDGVLVLDLPVEEAGPFRTRLVGATLDPIFLLSPTTSDARIRASADLGRGFLYVISRLGVTGARDRVAADAEALVARIRSRTDLPLALGFGISSPEQVAEVGRWADAAVVGSALVNVIAEHGAQADVAGRAGAYVRWLKGHA